MSIIAGLERFRVVLVEPAGPANVGAVARLMLNLGFGDLVLLRPMCDVLGDEARKMALAGLELIRNAPVLDDLAEALAPCALTAAYTRRVGRGRRTSALPRDFARLAAGLNPVDRVALVFGREDRGLTTAETDLCQHLVAIPGNPQYGSFNLAQSVAIALWEVSQAMNETPPLIRGRLASHAELRGMYNQLQIVLERIGLLKKGNPERTMTMLTRLIGRGEPNSSEVRVMRGALRDLRWYVRQVAEGRLPPLDEPGED